MVNIEKQYTYIYINIKYIQYIQYINYYILKHIVYLILNVHVRFHCGKISIRLLSFH